MPSGDPACTTITEVLEEIEARIVASPIAVELSELLAGPQALPSQRGSASVGVSRQSTRNLREQSRNQETARVEDTIAIKLVYRLSPKDQLTSRGVAYALVDSLRDLLTVTTWRRQWGVTHLDTVDQLTAEHITTTLRFVIRRYETLGGP